MFRIWNSSRSRTRWCPFCLSICILRRIRCNFKCLSCFKAKYQMYRHHVPCLCYIILLTWWSWAFSLRRRQYEIKGSLNKIKLRIQNSQRWVSSFFEFFTSFSRKLYRFNWFLFHTWVGIVECHSCRKSPYLGRNQEYWSEIGFRIIRLIIKRMQKNME